VTAPTCRTRSTQSYRHLKTAQQATSSFGVRPPVNQFPPVCTPKPWYLIRFQRSRCACAALLVKKITGGTAPGLGWSKALDRPEIAKPAPDASPMCAPASGPFGRSMISSSPAAVEEGRRATDRGRAIRHWPLVLVRGDHPRLEAWQSASLRRPDRSQPRSRLR